MPQLILTARNVKCTLVADLNQLSGHVVPNGSPPVEIVINVGERRIAGTLNAKSLRKACAAAAEGAGKHVVIQGTLNDHDVLENAGISVPVQIAQKTQEAAE